MTGCYFCGSSVDIEQHHILPRRVDGSDAESNLVDSCHECHWKLERLYNADFWRALGIEDPRSTKESHQLCTYHTCRNQATDVVRPEVGADPVPRCDDHRTNSKPEEKDELRRSLRVPDGPPDWVNNAMLSDE